MANYAIATANIVLQTATVTRAGFGTPIFISSHRSFQERIRSYGSAADVAEDFGTDSAAYIAATQFFAHSVSINTLKIGRREASGTYTPTNITTGSVHTITVTVNDGDAVTASYTAAPSDTEEDVVTALVAVITGDVDVAAHVTAALVGTGSSATMTLSLVGAGDVYAVSELLNVGESYTSTETAADVMTAIQDEDDDFYFVTAEDHTETFVLAMAGVVQAQSKLYFTSSQELTSITAVYSDTATDVAAQLKQANYTQTAVIWDDEADAKFVECNFVGSNAFRSPDAPGEASTWFGKTLPGLTTAKNSTGNVLTTTQRNNLKARNVSYIAPTAAGDVLVGAKTSGGKWIDEMRTLHCMAARLSEALELLVINAGGKLVGGRAGVALCEAEVIKVLNKFIASNALESFVIDSTNATIDQNTRTLSGLKFTAVLLGAIHEIVVSGTLVNAEV